MNNNFKSWFSFGRDILLLKTDAYTAYAVQAGVMKRGVFVLVAITMIAGSLPFLVGLVSAYLEKPPSPEEIFNPQQLLGPFAKFLPPDSMKGSDEIIAQAAPWVKMGSEISQLPTLMPKPIGIFFEKLGEYLSLPFVRLSSWLLYTFLVLFLARLMKGKASANAMLGVTALYAIPHLLDFFSVIPCLGGLLGLAASLWGVVIYIKAVALTSEFTTGKAVLVVALPPLIGIALGMLVAIIISLVSALG